MATENAVISSFDILMHQVFLLQSDPLPLEAPRRVVKSGGKKTAVVQTGRKQRRKTCNEGHIYGFGQE